jgi:Maltokinase N-terminal cap domain
VGVETILWQTTDGAIVQTPLTYRAAPLPGAETHLIGTSHHSVLGNRWVYDGCGDPVWAATLAAAILTGGTQADMYFEQDGERVDVPPRMRVRGSGGPGVTLPEVTSIDSVTDEGTVTVVRAGHLNLALARVVGSPLEGDYTLTGQVGDSAEITVLASLRRS